MFLLKWLLSVKNIRHLKNLLNFTVPKYVTCSSRPYDQKNFRWEAELISGTTPWKSTGNPVEGGRACSQAHSSFSSPEPVVSWSRGRLQIKPSGSGDKNGQSSLTTKLFSFFHYFSAAIFFAKKPFAEFLTNIHGNHALREWKRKEMCRPISRKDVQPWGRPCCYTRLRDSRVTPTRAAAKETTHTGGEWQDWACFTKNFSPEQAPGLIGGARGPPLS